VSFGDAWALAGLVLLVPIIVLHLRDRGRPVRDVPSLLLWQQVTTETSAGKRRLRPPILPLLLLLQALGLILIVIALANPFGGGGAPKRTEVFVLDDSFWMQPSGRMQTARAEVVKTARSLPAGALVQVVVAGPSPAVVYRGGAGGVAAAIAGIRPTAGSPDLPTALGVAAGLLTGPHDHVVVVHAPEDAVPAVHSSAGELSAQTAGAPIADQGIFDVRARCGIGPTSVCAVTAVVRNTGDTAVDDNYLATAGSHQPVPLSVKVAANSSADIALIATAGEQINLRLQGSDPLTADDQAWVTVPYDGGIPRTSVVTLVGNPSDALALARAFAAVPGLKLRLLTPAKYRAADARDSDLIVLDDFVPKAGLPPAPSVLLVDPPRLPSGHVGKKDQANPNLSGTDTTSALLSDVDLTALVINSGSARSLVLPDWLTPVAWSPDGPLLAAGSNGHQRLAVLSFPLSQSNLPQLSSFPILAANLVTWALGWAPQSAVADSPIEANAIPGARTVSLTRGGTVVARARLGGDPVTLTPPSPGQYVLSESGPGVSHSATVPVNVSDSATSSTTSIDLSAPHAGTKSVSKPARAPWFIIAALLVLVLEWAYWLSRKRVAVS
jgi:hypothetical protein